MSIITQTSVAIDEVSNNVIQNAACDSSVLVGNWVRMSGTTAINALADSLANSDVIGVVESKTSATVCSIRFLGLSTIGVFSGLDPDLHYFLSNTVPGAMTTTLPTAAGSVVLRLGQAFSADRFLVQKNIRLARST